MSQACLEAINLGTVEEPLYSCERCLNNYTKIKINSTTGIKDCVKKEDNLWYCLEGLIEENGAYKCTKCVEFASLNSSNQCECNSDYYEKNYSMCYKCDETINGNIRCNPEKGCKYNYSNNEFYCNECKSGYFNNTKGQCYSCENEIMNCDLCHYDLNKEKLQCDNCLTIYTILNEKDICELNECHEYPEISPGCIICNDKLNEYFQMKNVNHVNMVILKQKMKNAYIVEVKNMEALVVMNVDMNLMKTEMKKIILFVKIAYLLLIIIILIIIIIISFIMIIFILLILF